MTDRDDQKGEGQATGGTAPLSGASTEARIEALEAELQAAREEARRNQERWQRERADLENLKKRAAREQSETVKFANEAILKDLLPVVDNLERAVEHARGGGNGQPLLEGVALVLKTLLEVLERPTRVLTVRVHELAGDSVSLRCRARRFCPEGTSQKIRSICPPVARVRLSGAKVQIWIE